MDFDTPYGMATSRTQSIPEAPFDVGEFLTESTSPDSIDVSDSPSVSIHLDGSQYSVYSAGRGNHFQLPMSGEWPSTRYEASESLEGSDCQVRIVSDSQEQLCQDSSMLLTGSLSATPTEPKKARRQAQNRAAQRAFRERKEKYIQELEEQVLDMRKEITTLSQDRRRFESLLKVARAELKTLKSLPQQLTSQLRTDIDLDHLECKVHGLGTRRTVVLTIDLGVGGLRACTQSEVKGACEDEADDDALEGMNGDG